MRIQRQDLISKAITVASLTLSALLLIASSPRAHASDDDQYTIVQHASESKSFDLTATGQPRRIEVDNVFGSIHVVGVTGTTARVVVNETWSGETNSDVAQAHQEVKLDLTQNGNTLRAYVDGPFRCHCDCDDGCSREPRDYRATFEFEIQAPVDVALKLATVNQGHITVQNIAGDYSISNVNGPIELTNISGSGRARTVNGPVTATYSSNPRGNTLFATINGDLRVSLRPGANADVFFKNFNGDVFADFPMTSIAAPQPANERHGSRFVFRSSRFTGGRIGVGGPEIKLDGFNSNIYILEEKR